VVVFAYICKIQLIHIHFITHIWDAVVVEQENQMVVKATADAQRADATG
jgi:hypothetical protein